MRRGVLHVWWGTGGKIQEEKKTFFMLLGLWMFVVCSPVFFKNEPSILGSIDMIDSRRSAGCFWRAGPWVFGLQGHPGGLVLEILRNPGRLGKKTWENPVFLCLGGDNSNMFFLFSPFKLVGTSRQRLSEIEIWIKVEVPWGELNLNTLHEHIDLCVCMYCICIYMWLLVWKMEKKP